MNRVFFLSFLLALLTAGCMVGPRHGQNVGTHLSDIAFWGLVPNATDIVFIYRVDGNGELMPSPPHPGLAAAPSPMPTANPDAQGWYLWNTSLKLNNYDYWSQVPEGGIWGDAKILYMHVKPLRKIGDSLQPMATFDNLEQANQCIQDRISEGLAVVSAQCKSGNSPVVALLIPCGGDGQTCCKREPACEAGQCNSSTKICQLTAQVVGDSPTVWGSFVYSNPDETLVAPSAEDLFGHKLGLTPSDTVIVPDGFYDHKLGLTPSDPVLVPEDLDGHRIGI